MVSFVILLVARTARIACADRHTYRHTHTRDNYCNPRCACAPRVNYYTSSSLLLLLLYSLLLFVVFCHDAHLDPEIYRYVRVHRDMGKNFYNHVLSLKMYCSEATPSFACLENTDTIEAIEAVHFLHFLSHCGCTFSKPIRLVYFLR